MHEFVSGRTTGNLQYCTFAESKQCKKALGLSCFLSVLVYCTVGDLGSGVNRWFWYHSNPHRLLERYRYCTWRNKGIVVEQGASHKGIATYVGLVIGVERLMRLRVALPTPRAIVHENLPSNAHVYDCRRRHSGSAFFLWVLALADCRLQALGFGLWLAWRNSNGKVT